MGDSINEKILRKIKQYSEDEKMANFLIDLLCEEANHPGKWFWKQEYKKRIDRYLKDQGDLDEN